MFKLPTINKNKKPKHSAFSLIELSIVILVISVLFAVVISGKRFIKNSKISSAKSITNSSPIPLIDGLVFWAESVSDSSFNKAEATDGAELTNWYGSSITSNITLTSNKDVGSDKYPTYSYDGIGDIPAVQFDGTDKSFSFDCSFLNNSDYTIIINEQRESGDAGQYFLQGDNNNLFLGYNFNNSIIHSQSGATPYSATIPTYSNKEQRHIVFISSSSIGKKIYINGLEAASSGDISKISGLSTCYIGKGYNGRISEIAIYNRALPLGNVN